MINLQEGQLLLVDKPLEWTSFDVCNKIRFAIRRRLGVKKYKVGHSGTLDPLATGLLLVAVGKKTKTLHELQGWDKKYTGVIKLGATTASCDREYPEENHRKIDHITWEEIEATMGTFVGSIDQVPPIFSAIKKDGKRAYKSARQQQDIQLDARSVAIHSLKLMDYKEGMIHFECHCGKGTYIRSLARDIGAMLGVGGYLYQLRRTSIGEYNIDDARSIDDLLKEINTTV